MADVESVRARLEAAGQGHLLAFWDELSEQERSELMSQIEELDLDAIPRLVDQYVKNPAKFELPADLEPAPYYPRDDRSPVRKWDLEAMRGAGERLLREGKVACFTVAGGQGSRLGFDGPKGCYPAGAVSSKPLFAVFAEGIQATARRYGAALPWYIMTSPQNHEQTVKFFEEHHYFGLHPEDVMFFPQGTMPSLDRESGRILLAEKGRLATNPDGHGGSIRALSRSGALEDMAGRGIEHVSYFQVDNPLVRVADPVFLGLHAAAEDSSGEMSSKMVPKAYPEEKMGVFCSVDGRVRVIEYSDLPAELQEQRLEDGSLRFIAGSIAVHVMSVEFLNRLNTDSDFELPYHRAEKKVPCIDVETGKPVDPASPNGVKLERFVFDALPLCRSSIVYETEREEEFAPIKNAEGVDSAESSRVLQTMRAAKWLRSIGVEIPEDKEGNPDCTIELSPLTALEPKDLREAPNLPKRIEQGQRIAL